MEMFSLILALIGILALAWVLLYKETHDKVFATGVVIGLILIAIILNTIFIVFGVRGILIVGIILILCGIFVPL